MGVLTAANYNVLHKNVKSQLLSYGSNIWRVVCEGFGKDPIVDELLVQDVQTRCIIHNNPHEDGLNRLVGL